jgi:hypothetical protein
MRSEASISTTISLSGLKWQRIHAEMKEFFNLLKDLSQAVHHMNGVFILVKAVSGCTIRKKPSMNL